ncbi:c-type cytochrome [Tamlana fucoidanivorans]|nr:c-type cytochrome [Tamlana fucoidanivorans]
MAEGKLIFEQSGCAICHSLNGETMYGPALNSILGKSIHVLRDSIQHSITVDEDYIYRAIKDPDFEKNEAYLSKKMPLPILTDKQIEILSTYIIQLNKH